MAASNSLASARSGSILSLSGLYSLRMRSTLTRAIGSPASAARRPGAAAKRASTAIIIVVSFMGSRFTRFEQPRLLTHLFRVLFINTLIHHATFWQRLQEGAAIG